MSFIIQPKRLNEASNISSSFRSRDLKINSLYVLNILHFLLLKLREFGEKSNNFNSVIFFFILITFLKDSVLYHRERVLIDHFWPMRSDYGGESGVIFAVSRQRKFYVQKVLMSLVRSRTATVGHRWTYPVLTHTIEAVF